MNPLFSRLLILLWLVASAMAATPGVAPGGKFQGMAMAEGVADDRLAIAGAKVGRTLSEVKATAAKDKSLHVTADNRLVYMCKFIGPAGGHVGTTSAIQTGPDTSTFTGTSPAVTATSAFQLHSRPGAVRVLYLDFVGYIYPFSTGMVTPRFQLSGTTNPLDQVNLNAIRDIWMHVSEDFAAWDIDVTTAPPLASARGQRCVIGGSSMDWLGSMGVMGISLVGSFGGLINGLDEPNFVFVDDGYTPDAPVPSNYEVTILCVAHEVGHTLGLDHWGENWWAGSGGEYTLGHFISGHAGVTSVCPIMGSSGLVGWPAVCNLNQWSRGDYPFAYASTLTGTQDDLAVISTFVPLVANDYGNTLVTATAVSGSTITAGGVISSSTDVDLMKINAGVGPLSLTALTQSTYRTSVGSLKVSLSLLNSAGTVVARNYSVAGMGSTLTYSVPTMGTYYIKVVGVGYNPAITTWTNTGITGTVVGNGLTGFTNYGSIGRYSLTGSWTAKPNILPVASVLAVPTTGTCPLVVSFIGAASSDADGTVVGYNWNFGDTGSASNTSTAMNPSHTYLSPGTFIASLRVTDNDGGVSPAVTTVVTVASPVVKIGSMTATWLATTNVEITGQAAVQVVNQYGVPTRLAVVTVEVSGSVNGKAAARTDANGMVYITMPKQLKTSHSTYNFHVSNVVLANSVYAPGSNTPASAIVSLTR